MQSEIERYTLPADLPPGAEVVWAVDEGRGATAEVVLGGVVVARFLFDFEQPGRPRRESYRDQAGRPHGVERERVFGDAVVWTAASREGVLHGDSFLLDEHGRLLSATTFVRGEGYDLWGGPEGVGEVRPMRGGVPHGAVLWGDPEAPSEEVYYVAGRGKHGPHRRWADDGQLAPGFPHFYINWAQVDRATYDRACARDPSLRPYASADDVNRRAMPAAVAEARARAAAMADTFDLEAYLADADAAWRALFV